MNCTKCGTYMPDEAVACPNCGLPRFQQNQVPPPPPPNHQPTYVPPPSPPPPPRAGAFIPPPGNAGTGQSIPNYLIPSILVTLCCCLPLGVVAIIFAAQVNSKQAAGDIAGAMEASRKAKLFCWLAFGLGILINALILVANVSSGLFEVLQNTGG